SPWRWVAPDGPRTAGCSGGKNSASGTACTPTCCVCCGRPTNSIPTWPSSIASWSEPLGAESRPAPAPSIAAKKATNTRCLATATESRVASPQGGGNPGRPKELPADLYADRGYDSDATRLLLSWLGIEAHIARRR